MKCEWGTREGQHGGYCKNKSLHNYHGQFLCGKHFDLALPDYERRYERMRQAYEDDVLDDMPDDREQHYNERAEQMP